MPNGTLSKFCAWDFQAKGLSGAAKWEPPGKTGAQVSHRNQPGNSCAQPAVLQSYTPLYPHHPQVIFTTCSRNEATIWSLFCGCCVFSLWLPWVTTQRATAESRHTGQRCAALIQVSASPQEETCPDHMVTIPARIKAEPFS